MAASTALLTSVLLALAAGCAVLAVRPPAARRLGRSGRSGRAAASTPSVLHVAGSGRVAAAAATFVLVLLATRWVLLGVLAGVLVLWWDTLVHDRRADEERRRLEGIAKWLEDLRDLLRASSIGAEQALEQVARRPPAAVAGALGTFVQRRRQGFRIEDALADLADDLAHPTADAAVAAIRLVVSGATGAGRLFGTVDALAAAARDEVRARERVDRTRAVYQNSMKRLVVIGAALVAYLRFFAGDLLAPYSTATGQVVLLLPLGLWFGCVLWLRSLCRYDLPARVRHEVVA